MPGSNSALPDRYLEDASGFRGTAQRLIVPANESELAEALRDANATQTPVTIAGAGTGLTGARVPQGGWVISLEKFTRLDVHTGYAISGAGVLLSEVHAAAQRSGQFYPPDPTETSASIGGTIATNASGSRSFRYGATRRWLEGLRVVLADGSVREFARGEAIDFNPGTIPLPRVTKNTAGYLLRPGMDWIDLFAGSEGTLGVVTEARLKLLPAPKAILGGVVFFAGDDAAIDAVEVWRETASPRMLEYLDGASLDLLRTRFNEIPPAAHSRHFVRAGTLGRRRSRSGRMGRSRGSGACADGRFLVRAHSGRPRTFPPLPPLAPRTGQRNRAPQRRPQDGQRFRRSPGAKSRDAGVLQMPSGSRIPWTVRDLWAHRRCPRAREYLLRRRGAAARRVCAARGLARRDGFSRARFRQAQGGISEAAIYGGRDRKDARSQAPARSGEYPGAGHAVELRPSAAFVECRHESPAPAALRRT